MNEILNRIDKANHIVVISHINPDADSIGSASAVYTHILRLHKKVSWFCASKNISVKLKFLPWSEKIKNSFPASADLAISVYFTLFFHPFHSQPSTFLKVTPQGLHIHFLSL